MNNHMSLKLVGANSSLELNSPITSIYLQEELTGLTTLPGIRETKGMNIGMDGGWTSAQFYEPRLITIKGVIANQDVAVVEQRRKQLIQLLAEKRLALEFQTEAGNHYTMDVVVAGVQMPLSKVLTASYFQVNLRADDPLIYDNNALAELEAILRRSSSASSGFTINFPINFQLGTSESRPTIDNFGSSVIYPTITLTGPLTTPEIVNITTNMAFTIDEVLGAGTYTASGIRGAMDQEGSVDTYSGNPIQATRDAESPISKFSLYGDSSQTTYTGKNLFSTSMKTSVGSQITIIDLNSFSAVITGNWQGAISFDVPVPQNTQLHFNWHVEGPSAGQAIIDKIKGVQSDTTYVNSMYYNYWETHQSTTTFNTGEDTTIRVQIYVSGNNSSAGTYKVSNLQLEVGSSFTTFEPYVGGTASPNPDYPQAVNTVTGEQTVSITGKNLAQPLHPAGHTTISSNVTFTQNADGTVTANGTASNGNAVYSIGYPTVKPGRYVLSGCPDGGSASTYMIEAVYKATSSSSYSYPKSTGTAYHGVANISETGGFTGLYITIRNGTTVNNLTFSPQIERTSGSPTAYEPYQGQSLPVNLGKNMFKFAQDSGTATRSGITVEAIENGAIKVNGTVTSDVWFELMMSGNFLGALQNTTTQLFSLDSNKSYTLSVRLRSGTYTESTSSTNKTNVYVQTSSTNTQKNSNLGGTATTFTGADGIYRGWMRFIGGYTFDNAVLEIQLEEGTKQTAYAPLLVTKNLLPIPNPYALTGIKTYDITLSPGTYTLSLAGATTTGSSQASYFRVFDDDNTDLATNTVSFSSANSWTFTLSSTATKFAIYSQNTYAGSSGVTTTFRDLMLEQSGTKTFYEPYGAPYKLCKIGDYQDRIYKTNGKWYVHKEIGKVVFDGSESWATQNDAFVRGLDDIAQGEYNAEILMVSDHFTGRKTCYRGDLTDGQCAKIIGNNQQIGFRYDALNDVVADWQTWLGTHNTTVYYVLATPYDTEITSEALIDQLDAILEAHLYEGINDISNVTASPNLSGDLEIKTGQTLTVINSLSIVGSSGAAEIGLGGSELAMVGSVADELTINGTTGAVTKTTRIGKIASYAGETITTDYISTSGGLDSDATIYYVLPSSSTSVINTLDSTALTAFNNVVASGGVSAQTNIGSISVDVTTVTAQDVAVVDTKQHTVTINGVGAYSKFSGDWLTLDVGLNELQLITENNTDTGSAVIKYRVGYMGV